MYRYNPLGPYASEVPSTSRSGQQSSSRNVDSSRNPAVMRVPRFAVPAPPSSVQDLVLEREKAKKVPTIRLIASYRYGISRSVVRELRSMGLFPHLKESLALAVCFDMPENFDISLFMRMRYAESILIKIFYDDFRNLTIQDLTDILIQSPAYESELRRVDEIYCKLGLLKPGERRRVSFRIQPVHSNIDDQDPKWKSFSRRTVSKVVEDNLRSFCNKQKWELLPDDKLCEADLRIVALCNFNKVLVGIEMVRNIGKRKHIRIFNIAPTICSELVRICDLQDNNVLLDMFCGSGEFLLEALAMHSVYCVGIEKNNNKLTDARKNLSYFTEYFPTRASQLQLINADAYAQCSFFNFFTVDVLMCNVIDLYESNKGLSDTDVNKFLSKLLQIFSNRCRPNCRVVLVLPQAYNVSFSILVKNFPVEAKEQFQVGLPTCTGFGFILITS